MELNFQGLSNGEKIKRIAAFRGLTNIKLGKEFNKRFGTKYSESAFNRKLRDNSISFSEMEQFGQILNFDVKLVLRD